MLQDLQPPCGYLTEASSSRSDRVMYNQEVAIERASYNGSIEASQASDVGSIPIARSITHEVQTGHMGDIPYRLHR
jgi:hypothetical protein